MGILLVEGTHLILHHFYLGQFHMAKAQLGAKLLRLNKNKGWLVPPPLHVNYPEK